MILVIIAFLLSSFGHIDVSIKATGEIQPAEPVAIIQSSSNEKVKTNQLKENKEVKKGELLLKYENSQDSLRLSSLNDNLNTATKRQTTLQSIIQGLHDDNTSIPNNDEFGYSSMLSDFRSQAKTIAIEGRQEKEKQQNQNSVINGSRHVIEDQIQQVQTRINEYSKLKVSIERGQRLDCNSPLFSLYESYTAQINSKATDSKPTAKNQVLLEIQSTLQGLEDTLSGLLIQKQGIGNISTVQETSTNKIEALRSEFLLKAYTELASIKSKIAEIDSQIQLLQRNDNELTITAPSNGVIHVNADTNGLKKIPLGTKIAEIYPTLTTKTKLSIITYIPAAKITDIRIGNYIQLESSQDTSSPLVLRGTVVSVDSSPTRTEQGNFFKVVGRLENLSHIQLKLIRYGLQGRVTVTVGTKTIFHYVKDRLLNYS